MKSMMALAAATVIVTSAFMQPAVSQIIRKGNGFSLMGGDESSVTSQFNLVDKDRDGNTIGDTYTFFGNIGFFPKAIENYKQGLLARPCLIYDTDVPICTSGLDNGRYKVDDSGFLILIEEYDPDPPIIPFDGDLKAELIVNDPFFEGRDTIAYSIFKLGEVEPVQRYRLDFSNLGFNKDQALNDFSYIFEQDLLSKVRLFSEDTIVTGRILLQNRFEEDLTRIPESQTTTSLLALGILGAIYAVKHHKK
ncbi:hypothetical protein IQ276_007920 [Desmonostoc muscorum LEGE 12446]|uniref:PEP-CTERM sorting domain-containing protein n=1 Tax=Desmonostoc muscorum LEGE 12446 TaxID=1828758 RepID=A0A8J6ZXI5_DESMC|nr:hypothetical protein [Desmonostoc muscorum]MCF2146376.1 hypothetical protein [Desmonostoc muscorum LEGE 12446]